MPTVSADALRHQIVHMPDLRLRVPGATNDDQVDILAGILGLVHGPIGRSDDIVLPAIALERERHTKGDLAFGHHRRTCH